MTEVLSAVKQHTHTRKECFIAVTDVCPSATGGPIPQAPPRSWPPPAVLGVISVSESFTRSAEGNVERGCHLDSQYLGNGM